MGQKLLVYPSVPLICTMQTTRGGLYNSQLLNVRSYDTTHIEVEDAESGKIYQLTHEWVRTHTRSAHAVTISSCQGRQWPAGTKIALWDTRHRMWTKRHLYTSISRGRTHEELSIED